jgi:hypothetical protein
MSHESTRFFSVVGSAYIPESHAERDGFAERRSVDRSEACASVSLSWLTGWWPRTRR